MVTDTVLDRKREAVNVAGLREVNFAISERTMAILEELSTKLNKPIGEILRDAIALEKWYEDLRDHDGRILVEQDGKIREFLSA